MAIRLNAWLEDAFESQLLLGNQWLQDRHEKKKSCDRPAIDRQWSAYHDNGSSLDTISYVSPKRTCALKVLKLSPLTLTDGQIQIISHFTPDCARDFFQLHPAIGTIIAARKYTVRYTSYGSPRKRLRLILNHFDWLADSCKSSQNPNSDRRKSLHACERIGALLEQLRHIRALEDHRCLISGPAEAEVGIVNNVTADSMGLDDNIPDGNDLHSQMHDTQLPFGTQLPQPSRPRTSEHVPQIIGVNRLEPVMAGNTQRAEIRSGAANTEYEQRMKLQREKLLNTLGRRQKASASASTTTPVQGFVQFAFSKPRSAPAPTTDESPNSPSDLPHPSSSQPEVEFENGEAASSMPDHGKKRVQKVRGISPEAAKAAERSRVEEHVIQQSLLEDSSDKPSECSWMKGFVFNSETLRVPNIQAQCLRKETSWLKPQPGVPHFQYGNMPHMLLKNMHLMADERAAVDSDDDSDIDPSPESFDPSPESLLQKTQDKEPATTQDDDDMVSQVSWENSPEPPERLTRPQQALPPDSSTEKQASYSEHESASQPGSTGQQRSHPPVIDLSDNDGPANPLSSPPAPAAPADSDDEMEMEESVPQALGEDLIQRTQPPPPVSDKLPISDSLRSPVVQVKETPYGKGKSASVPKNAPKSSAESKPTSSTSIVHSTYDTPSLSDPADLGLFETAKEHSSHTREKDISAERKRVEVHQEETKDANTDDINDIEMLDDLPDTEDPNKETACSSAAIQQPPNDIDDRGTLTSTSHATPHLAQLPPNNGGAGASSTVSHLASQSTKRKLIVSPTKSNRRQSKRREIKIVGFGDDVPPGVDLIGSLQKEREQSLRRYREQRNSSITSFDSRPEPTSKLTVEYDSDAMEVDGVVGIMKKEPSPSLSPRHQGLYDEPSPRIAELATIPAPQPSKSHTSPKSRSRDTQTRSPVPISAKPSSISSEIVDEDGNMTVFQSFIAAYPEYNGNEKHFENQCNQMFQLEQEDKMVPKWQWDDFIIRNRTDYSQYAMDCIDRGEDPEPYYRFYKNNIRNTLYVQGIVQNTKTLQRALEELGGARIETTKPRQLPQPIQKPKPARKPLQEAFEQPKKPTQDRVKGASSCPRHFLPTNSHIRPESRVRPSSSVSSSRPQPRHSDSIMRVSSAPRTTHQTRTHRSPSEPDETFNNQGSTRDRFKDFYFGYQRITSLTGSTAVDANKQWPQNLAVRPTVADALPPRKKVDVLNWGDVLGKTG